MLPFIIVAFVLAVLSPSAVKFLHANGWIEAIPSFLYESAILMAFITTVIFVYLYRSRKTSHFTQLYLLSMVVKLITALVFIVAIVVIDRAGAVANAVYFMVLYFVFTAVEVGFLYPKISGSSPR